MAPTLEDFNRAAALDRDAMKLVDDAVMARCDGDVMKYAAAYDQLFQASKLAAPAPTPRPVETEEELDESIRRVMAEENVSYHHAFAILGNRRDQQRATGRVDRSQATATEPAKSSAAVCKCCSGPKLAGEKPCGCATRKSPTDCACHADCSICIELNCKGVNAEARARASFVADRVLNGARASSGRRRGAMCPFDQPLGRGARIVAFREDCEFCASGRPHPWQTGPEAA